jgi:ABC-type nitrate/sulfonate/bicarbonate transport system ATPase subunit
MIEIRGLGKQFGPTDDSDAALTVLEDVTFQVADNEFLTIIGPSGCGKTTLLRLIAGLIPRNSGEIVIDGVPVSDPGPDRAVVFQNFALLPWADVLDNIAFGLRVRGMPRAERRERARELAQLVGLAGFETTRPRQLSGGMQQRVGLARALVVDPKILLLDEPFGALDEQTRLLMQEELLRIWDAYRKTVIFVTHSMDEAILLGDRVMLMSPAPGRIREFIDVPFPRPRTREVEGRREFHEIKEHLWDRLRGVVPAMLPGDEAQAKAR